MIKLRSGNALVIGLSERNLELLREEKPIVIKLREFNVDTDVELVIMWGATEPDIARSLHAPPEIVAETERVWQEGEERRKRKGGS